jgi:hypothetical protein
MTDMVYVNVYYDSIKGAATFGDCTIMEVSAAQIAKAVCSDGKGFRHITTLHITEDQYVEIRKWI